MKIDRPFPTVRAESLLRKHESGEPRVLVPMIMTGCVVIMIIICLCSSTLVMFSMSRERPLHDMKEFGLLVAPSENLLDRFPKPHLQLDDGFEESTTLHDMQNAKLYSYGWVDRTNGIVHIPISRAMDLILAQGLPRQTNAPTDSMPLELTPPQ